MRLYKAKLIDDWMRTMTMPRKRSNKPDPSKLALTEITAAIDQLFVREKFACGPRRTGVA